MQNTIFYTIGVACTSGIFLRSFFDFGVSGILLVGTAGLACLLSWKIVGTQKNGILFLGGLFCIFGAIGMARLEYAEEYASPYSALEGEKVVLEARVVQEPEVRETTTQLYIKPIDKTIGNERILVTVDRYLIENQNIQYGDEIRIEGTLKKPKSFSTDTGKEFDYAGFLRAKGVTYVIGFAKVALLSHKDTFMGNLFQGKKVFLGALEQAIPPPASGLGAGMLLGVRRALGEQLDTVFREVGIIHIVVLSGYNIMVVVNVLMYILAYVFFPRMRMVVGTLGIILFALLVGLSATVVRASFMAVLLLVAQSTGRSYAVLRALVFAGIVMLFINPYLLVHDPGFQLSFLATLGLILFSPHIEKHLTSITENFGMRSFVTATLATQVIVLPLLLYHTGMVSLISVVTNMLVLPVVPVVMILTGITGVLALISDTLGIAVGYITYLSLQYVITVAEICARVPFATVTISSFPFWGMVLMYVGIVWTFVRFESREKEGTKSVTNEYDGWVIEEEIEKPEKVQSTFSGPHTPLPFR